MNPFASALLKVLGDLLGFAEDTPPPYIRVQPRKPKPRRYVEASEVTYAGTSDGKLELAVNEMTVCKEIFDKWGAVMDEAAHSKRPSEKERRIRELINGLQDSAEGALFQTECIVKAHLSFSDIMAKRFQDVAHDGGVLESIPEIIQTAESIRDHSAAMSVQVEKMCHDLVELTVKLEEVKRKDKTLKGRIMRWLARAFDALSVALGLSGAVTSFFFPPVGAGAAISSAASTVVSSMNKNKSGDKGFEKAILFLRETVPQETVKVRASLKKFNECHQAVQLEMELKKGELIGIHQAVARKAEVQWSCRKAQLELINVRPASELKEMVKGITKSLNVLKTERWWDLEGSEITSCHNYEIGFLAISSAVALPFLHLPADDTRPPDLLPLAKILLTRLWESFEKSLSLARS